MTCIKLTEAIPGSVLEFYSSGATDLKATDIQQNIEKIYLHLVHRKARKVIFSFNIDGKKRVNKQFTFLMKPVKAIAFEFLENGLDLHNVGIKVKVLFLLFSTFFTIHFE